METPENLSSELATWPANKLFIFFKNERALCQLLEPMSRVTGNEFGTPDQTLVES
jgi:hypothetical protein